ncbi:MAG: porin [Burkholderiaceae bacterium]
MRSRLLVAAIAAALGMSSVGALATPLQDQTTTPTNGDELNQLKAQLARLQAQVDALQQRDQAQPVATRTVAAADDGRLARLEKSVGDTSVSGKIYVDFTQLNQNNSDSGKTDKSGTGLDMKRFYLGIEHKFNDIWSANLTTDFNYVSNDGQTNLFVKKAYVQGKFDQALVFRVGSADMPWIGFVENYYGFRYVENTITDRLKYGNSADWGLHLAGDIGAGKSLNYAVSVVNGNGYKDPSRSKGVDVEGRVGFVPFENMVIAVGGYSGHRGKQTQNIDAIHTAQRGDVLAAYAGKTFRLGGEYFTAKNWNNVLSPLTDKADGYSFWGSVNLADHLAVFARYDNARLSKDLDPKARDVYYNLGLEYQVTPGFKLAAVYKHGKSDRSVAAPTPPHVQNVRTDEVGLFGEVKF